MYTRFILLFLLVAVACKGPDNNKTNLTSSATTELATPPDSISEALTAFIKNNAINAKARMAVKVGKPGKIVMYYGYDGRSGKPFDRFDIPYEIGSQTKMFTASAVLQLIEQGKVNLETPFVEILTGNDKYDGLAYSENGIDYIDSVKVRNLINHTSGLPDYFLGSDDEEIENYGDGKTEFSMDDLLALSKKSTKERFKPGSKYDYSNINYALLGQIIEKVSGQSYTDYVQEHIIDKLGLEHTYFGTVNPPEQMEQGHFKEGMVMMPYTYAGPAGEIISTLDDMYTFIDGHYNGTLFEKEETLDHLQHAYFHDMGMGMEYGLGVIKFRNFSWGHAGQTFGFQSFSAGVPNGYRFTMFIDDAHSSIWVPAMGFSQVLSEQP